MGCYILSERYDQEFSTLLVCWARSFLSEVKCYLAEFRLNINFDPRGLPKFSPPTKKILPATKNTVRSFKEINLTMFAEDRGIAHSSRKLDCKKYIYMKGDKFQLKMKILNLRYSILPFSNLKIQGHTDDVFQLKTFQMHQPEKVFKLDFFIFPSTIEEILRRCSNCVLPKKEKGPLPFQFQRGKSIF